MKEILIRSLAVTFFGVTALLIIVCVVLLILPFAVSVELNNPWWMLLYLFAPILIAVTYVLSERCAC